jgi:hypothetical protein
MKNKCKMISLTTKVHPRTYLAIKSLSAKANQTESAWLRNLIEDDVAVHTEPVNEAELDILVAMLMIEKKKKKAKRNVFASVKSFFGIK